VERTGRQRAHDHVIQNLGHRLRAKHNAELSRLGTHAVSERKCAADSLAAQHTSVATHCSRGIAKRGRSTFGVERFDYRGDRSVEVRALVGADFGEI
jgi:hypothetical protein